MKIAVTNTTQCPIYCGSLMIPAGETREVEEHFVPDHLKPAAPPPPASTAPADPLAELSTMPVKQIVAQIPSLTVAQLETLGELEQAKGDKARKSLLEPIAEELLKRAEGDGAGRDDSAGGEDSIAGGAQ